MTFKISLSPSLQWLDHSKGLSVGWIMKPRGLGAHGLRGPAFPLGGLCRWNRFRGLYGVGRRAECGPPSGGAGGEGAVQRLHSEDTVSFPAFTLSFQQHKKLPSIKSHEIKLYGFTCFERFKVLYMSDFLLQIPGKLWRPNKVQESRYYGGRTPLGDKVIISAGSAYERNLLKQKTHKLISGYRNSHK